MSIRRGCLAWLLAGAGLAGCGAADGGPAVAVRDSAGVRLVDSRRAAADWTVDGSPSVAIGTADGAAEYQLSRVRGAVRLSDGRVVVADGDTRRLRWYDAAGRHLADAGGPGGGPGEFAFLEGVVPYRGDSVAAWDPESRRLSLFGPDAAFARSATVEGIEALSVSLRGALADGTLLLELSGSLEGLLAGGEGERRDTVTYVRATPAGAVTDTLAVRADQEHVTRRMGPVVSRQPVLFGRDSHVAAGGGQVFVGESDGYRIDVLRPDGALRTSIRRPGEPRPVRGEDRERAREAARQRGERTREQLSRAAGSAVPPSADDLPERSTMPAFDQLLVDAEGFLWVRDARVVAGDPGRWSVFSPDGAWQATVTTPAGLDVFQVGRDWILGRSRDEWEVESIRLHRLRRG